MMGGCFMNRKIVPDIVKPREIISVSPDDNIIDSAVKMVDAHVAALVVFDDNENLVGIVTERDMTHRVVAKGLDTRTATVSEIMTENPDTLSPDDFAMEALDKMQSRHFRHLPVMDGGKVINMVSIRDLFAAVKTSLEEDIQETEAFVFGDRYGA